MRIVAMILICLLSGGCLALDPAGAIGGLKQRQIIGWDADGNFSFNAVGTHEARITMAEGDIVLAKDADGNDIIDWEQSTISAYLRADPKADEAASALGLALLNSTKQMDRMGDSFDSLAGGLIATLGGGAPRAPPVDNELAEALRRIEERLAALKPTPP